MVVQPERVALLDYFLLQLKKEPKSNDFPFKSFGPSRYQATQ